MKLYQALELKKKIKKDIKILKSRFIDNNIFIDNKDGVMNNSYYYKPDDIIDELNEKNKTLHVLNVQIHLANSNIIDKLKLIDIHNDTIDLYRRSNSKIGKKVILNEIIEYCSIIPIIDIDNEISKLEDIIEKTKDEIYIYNYTTEIDIDVII